MDRRRTPRIVTGFQTSPHRTLHRDHARLRCARARPRRKPPTSRSVTRCHWSGGHRPACNGRRGSPEQLAGPGAQRRHGRRRGTRAAARERVEVDFRTVAVTRASSPNRAMPYRISARIHVIPCDRRRCPVVRVSYDAVVSIQKCDLAEPPNPMNVGVDGGTTATLTAAEIGLSRLSGVRPRRSGATFGRVLERHLRTPRAAVRPEGGGPPDPRHTDVELADEWVDEIIRDFADPEMTPEGTTPRPHDRRVARPDRRLASLPRSDRWPIGPEGVGDRADHIVVPSTTRIPTAPRWSACELPSTQTRPSAALPLLWATSQNDAL